MRYDTPTQTKIKQIAPTKLENGKGGDHGIGCQGRTWIC